MIEGMNHKVNVSDIKSYNDIIWKSEGSSMYVFVRELIYDPIRKAILN